MALSALAVLYLRFPGALPQARVNTAPLALNTYLSVALSAAAVRRYSGLWLATPRPFWHVIAALSERRTSDDRD